MLYTAGLYKYYVWMTFHFLLQGTRYRAIYDYNAKQDDEVSFIKGDVILYPSFCNDDGWMEGYNQRTEKRGLFPINHVQKLF